MFITSHTKLNVVFGRIPNAAAYALCLIAPWSLLWLDKEMLFPYITGKSWVFRSLIELAFALSLISRLSNTRYVPSSETDARPVRFLLVVLIAFAGWTALSNQLGVDPYRSFWSNWERMSGFIDYIHWAMYLFCLLVVLDRARARLILINLLAVITLVCAVGFLDEEARIISTLGNPIYLGNLAVFGLFIAAFFLADKGGRNDWKAWLNHLLILIAMAVMGVALMKSASRGPMFALLAGALVVLAGAGWFYARAHSRKAVALLLVVVLISGGALVSQFSAIQATLRQSDSYALQRIGRISLENQTTADRLENWRIALDAAQSRPLIGWGQENYTVAFNEFYRAGVMDKAKLWFDRTHNAYLDQLLASGLPGLVLYILILSLPVFLVARVSNWSYWQKSILSGLLVAFAAKNIIGFDTFSSTLVWLTCVGFVIVACTSPQAGASKMKIRHFWRNLVTLVLLLAVGLSITWLNVRPYQANQRFSVLMSNPLALRSQALTRVLAQPAKELVYAQNAKLAVLDRVLENAGKRPLTELETKRKDAVFKLAGELTIISLERQPRNYRIKYNAAVLLARNGNLDLSIQLLEELTQAAPNRTAFWFTLAKAYTARGKAEQAKVARETAIALNSDWKP